MRVLAVLSLLAAGCYSSTEEPRSTGAPLEQDASCADVQRHVLDLDCFADDGGRVLFEALYVEQCEQHEAQGVGQDVRACMADAGDCDALFACGAR